MVLDFSFYQVEALILRSNNTLPIFSLFLIVLSWIKITSDVLLIIIYYMLSMPFL